VALAGSGNFHFIYKFDEVEEKVIAGMQANYIGARTIESINVYDKQNEYLGDLS